MPATAHLVRDIEKQFRDRNLRGISDTKAVRIKDRGRPEASRRLDKSAYPRHIELDD
jgi:hypothetical protein